ncbi:MAG: tRNA guanosine(34) transglycosylase Tgt, partial [Planctomycetota bacterium]
GCLDAAVALSPAAMPAPLQFEISARSSTTHARVGRVTTPHGSFDTPAFMPVGTRATVKGLLPELVERTGSQIILNNTYHLMLRPGSPLVRELGGVHQFMRWPRPILTDSGGYQVFSMSDINRINDDGVTFRSIIDGRPIDLTPERSIEIQNDLGADIIMAFDDCPPSVDPANLDRQLERLGGHRLMAGPPPRKSGERRRKDRESPAEAHARRLDEANDRTARWLERCVRAHARKDEQALFGIVQGGTDLDRRTRSVEQVCSVDLPGYAVGGVAVGESSDEIARVVAHTAPLLPEDRPRYLMGVGYEWDIVNAVRSGIDMFDCVLPTRNGRNANAFTRSGQIRLRNARYRDDAQPIEAGCPCIACADGYSRAYLRHLFIAEEMLGPVLVSLHNIAHFQALMMDIRASIGRDDWDGLLARWPVLNHVQASRVNA